MPFAHLFSFLLLIFALCAPVSQVAASTPACPVEPQAHLYTEADIRLAYDAFNRQLLDPERRVYYRDTEKPREVGAIWTQAIYWDMTMNAYQKTRDKKYLQLIKSIFEGNKNHYAQYDWNNEKVWFIYDDIMWWVISLARGYEITGNREYLRLAESGFERVWSGSSVVGDKGSYDPIDGGMYWNWDHKNPTIQPRDMGKMACINYPTVIAAMTLFNITKERSYRNRAMQIYQWSHFNLFDEKTGRVADSKHGKGSPNWTTTVYNQGTAIGAAVMLYNETKQQHYLNDAIVAANYTRDAMSSADGILPFKRGEEQGIYTAIFAQYIIRLIEDGNRPEYIAWLQKNIISGWNNRDRNRNLTFKDYTIPCPTDTKISCYDASGIPALMLVTPLSQ
ncbi:MAG: glycoside hydrolase family 76 protein [Bacteroidales bacterium]